MNFNVSPIRNFVSNGVNIGAMGPAYKLELKVMRLTVTKLVSKPVVRLFGIRPNNESLKPNTDTGPVKSRRMDGAGSVTEKRVP